MSERGYDIRAVRFHRLVIGLILLAGFVFSYTPLVIAALILLLIFLLFSPRFSPLYRLYFVLRGVNEVRCDCDPGEVRFSCLLALAIVAVGSIMHLFGHESLGMFFIFIAAVLSVVAGATGFCLGKLVYVWLRKGVTGA
ncbi:MAG: DUF4395 family protein [Nitrospirae bacterium]|nr:MAG: DUF4395 family protein [Nitrospirota bacterium]